MEASGAVLRQLECIQIELRIWRCVGVAVLAFVLLGASTASKVPEEIQARKFVVVDGNGQRRAVLDGESEESVLMLWDKQRKSSVVLVAGSSGPYLNLDYDEHGMSPSTGKLKEEASKLKRAKTLEAITDALRKETRSSISLGINPLLFLTSELEFRAKGRTRAALNLGRDGSPSVSLYDEAGKTRTVIGEVELQTPTGGNLKTGSASLVLFDAAGKVIWKTP